MKLNVENLNVDIKKYNKLINYYEQVCFKFYSELNLSKEYWLGNDANYFFANIEEEKIKVQLFYKELFSIGDLYIYLVKKYQVLGKKILIELNEKDNILTKFDDYIVKFENLINYYKNIDTNFDVAIGECIKKQQELLEKNRLKIEIIKDKYKKFFSNVEEIELEVKERLSKINIEVIKEITTKLKILGTDIKPYMYVKNMENSIKVLQFYKNEEDITFEEIQDTFLNIIYNYNTSNKKLLDNILLDINNRVKIINNNHLNELTILRNKVDSHKNTSFAISQILEETANKIDFGGDL